MQILTILAIVGLSYLIGSIPSGWVVVKIAIGKDVRQIESGRTGGTNAMRAAGFLAGLITAILDVLKGVASAWVVNWLWPGNVWLMVAAALMAIIGHNYSIFLMRRNEQGRLQLMGGAGGATCLGGAIALWLPIGAIILPLSALVFVFVGYASITTISVAFFATVIFIYKAWSGALPWPFVAYGIVSLLIVLLALRPNLERLRQGNERMVGLRAYLKKKAVEGQSRFQGQSKQA